MKWIVLVIVVSLGAYTFLTLHYRKPGRSYRPYEDGKNRANTARLLSAGYQRVTLLAHRPADVPAARDTTLPAAGGLPESLRTTLVSLPRLPAEIISVHAAPTTAAAQPYAIQLRCAVPSDNQQLGGAELYVKGEELIITPDFELLSTGLLTRSRETFAVLTVPPATLKPGHYRATIVGQRTSRSWTLDVQ